MGSDRQTGAWQYWRGLAGNVVEVGLVRGLNVALPVHFHPEDQITLVTSGKRKFVVRDELVEVVAGESVTIPAGTPHRSVADTTDVCCINIYVSPGAFDARDLIANWSQLSRPADGAARLNGTVTFDGLHRTLPRNGRSDTRSTIQIGQRESVGLAADRAGMSREGFSRRFKRLQGLPPEDFRLLSRLNEARRLLRAGMPIATAAAETGFADQSHLGRCFRRIFGTTPGLYRNGLSGTGAVGQQGLGQQR